MSPIGRLAAFLIAGLLAAGCGGGAWASDTALCTYLKAVVAARASEFVDLKGAPDTRVDSQYYRFHGRLQSKPGDDCTTSPRHYTHDVGAAVAPPYYDCVIATESDYDAAEADYAAAAGGGQGLPPRLAVRRQARGRAGRAHRGLDADGGCAAPAAADAGLRP